MKWWGKLGLAVLLFAGGGAAGAGLNYFLLPLFSNQSEYVAATVGIASSSAPVTPAVTHLATPEPLRALYMTQCAAASPSLRDHLLQLASSTEINAVVVDLKDYSGTVVFPSVTAVAGGRGCTYSQFETLVKTMHEAGIYVIGRLTVFQDPLYTQAHPTEAVQSLSRGGPWRDRKGLSFVDVAAKPFHDYIIALAREAQALGVDEINFDYIRYPSDGDMKDASYLATGLTKAENLEQFFKYLSSSMRSVAPEVKLSADLFGMTATNLDDLGIGQVLERALPYFDYVAPMVYPSHYPKNFNGWPDPNARAYDLIKFSLGRAVSRTVATTTPIASAAYLPLTASTSTSTAAATKLYQKPSYPAGKIRPWLQDFDYPVTYTAEMVRDQIQATYDVGLTSWMLWDPANRYTPSALLPISS